MTYHARRATMLLLLVLGVACVCTGLALLSIPVALIAAGIAIAAFGLLAIEVSP